jgi:hypothetical protein
MSPRDPRVLLAPDPDQEPIPVSRRTLVELLRQVEERNRVAESLDATYRDLGEEIRGGERTPHAQGDETGMPVNGRWEWLGVGTSPTATVYHIQEGRRGEEAAAMWAGYRGKLTHDGPDSYNSLVEAEHRFDLVYGNRWLQKVEASHGIRTRGFLNEEGSTYLPAGRPPREFLVFAAGVRVRLRKEVRWT